MIEQFVDKKTKREKHRKSRRKMMLVLSIPVVIIFIALVSNPLRWPETMLSRHIIRSIPLGTHIDDVLYYIENNRNWNVSLVNSGYRIGDFAESPNITRGRGNKWQTGTSETGYYRYHFLARIGSYRNISETSVGAIFVFDENGYLIQVFIRKDSDFRLF